jgi:hypothetical protein
MFEQLLGVYLHYDSIGYSNEARWVLFDLTTTDKIGNIEITSKDAKGAL